MVAVQLLWAVTMASPVRAQRSSYEELQTFSSVVNYVRLNYADSVGYARLVRAAIQGMLADLDPHSHYLSRAENERLALQSQGRLGTPGLYLEEVRGALTVLSVDPDGPADRGGVFPGDRLVAVDDTVVAGLGARELEIRLFGKTGSKVRLTFERGPLLEPDSFTVRVKRELRARNSVSMARMLGPRTAYIRLDRFQPAASAEIRKALRALRKRGAVRVILDLRGNPGGLVHEAVDVASLFLPKKSVVFRTRGRKHSVDADYVTSGRGPFYDLPMIVLIDAGTASAAEALAGSLQDNDRALVLGRRSFGKALIQSPFFLPNGDVVWLTIGRVLTPSGRLVQRRYEGLSGTQYYSLAGSDASEPGPLFRTAAGRPVRGGGGIAPDSLLAGPAALPVWWGRAVEHTLPDAIADSVAQDLTPASEDRVPASEDRVSDSEAPTPDSLALAAWIAAPDRWRERLLGPFLQHARSDFHIDAEVRPEVAEHIARLLARRVAAVRWGSDASEEFSVRTDPDIRAALAILPRLTPRIAGPVGGG